MQGMMELAASARPAQSNNITLSLSKVIVFSNKQAVYSFAFDSDGKPRQHSRVVARQNLLRITPYQSSSDLFWDNQEERVSSFMFLRSALTMCRRHHLGDFAGVGR